uniref:Uncharacterized protein n=1 Tax=Pithovirus LCDPAC02 TaxID=2506601 RepID=A0A481YRE3_9VIRU|nr:MAG: hypothetical protein LCDPAC02_02250 [Pithovirus LCDPAC02]
MINLSYHEKYDPELYKSGYEINMDICFYDIFFENDIEKYISEKQLKTILDIYPDIDEDNTTFHNIEESYNEHKKFNENNNRNMQIFKY